MSCLSEIQALEQGHECVFFGRERNTPWAMMSVEVSYLPPDELGPYFVVSASYYLKGVKHSLRREYRDSRFAAEWIDYHLVRYTISIEIPQPTEGVN